MESNTFLDRDTERERVRGWLDTQQSSSICLIIAGRSGVGKTTFTRHVSLEDKHRLYIRVSIPRSAGKTLQAGSYLRHIAIELDSIIRTQVGFETFEERTRSRSRRSAMREVATSALDVLLTQKVRKLLASFREKWMGTGAHDWRKKLLGNTTSDVSDIRQYLTGIFQLTPIGLIIENAQNIDEYSLAWIENVVAISERHVIFLEWTAQNSSDASDLKDLVERFKPYCPITEVVWLKKLPLLYAIQIIPEGRIAAREWLSDSYGMWDGNLIPLVDLDVLVTSDIEVITNGCNFPEIEDNSAHKFRQLSFEQQVMMSVVLLSGGQIEKEILLGCMVYQNSQFTVIDLNANLDQLALAKLLHPSPGASVSVRHDSIANDLIEDIRFTKVNTIAASTVRTYCQIWLQDKDQHDPITTNILFFLLHAQVYLDDVPGALSSIENICQLKATSHSPTVLCDALLDIVALCKRTDIRLPADVAERLVLEIVSVCIRNRIFSPAEDILELVENPTTTTRLLEALVYLGMEKTGKTLEICSFIIEHCTPNSHISYCAEIVSYVAERHLGHIDAGRTRWEGLVDMLGSEYSGLSGFILRNAEMFFPPRKSVPFLVQSIRRFSDEGNEVQFAYSINALAGQLLRLGKFRSAKSLFNQSLAILRNTAADSLSIESNLAIAQVRLDEFGPQTLTLFEKAAIGSNNNNFGQLAVANNITSYYFLIGNFVQTKKSATTTVQLLQRRSISSPQVKRSIYRSLEHIASNINDKSILQQLHKLDIKLDIEPDVYLDEVKEEARDKPAFIILTNWYPDPEIALSQTAEEHE